MKWQEVTTVESLTQKGRMIFKHQGKAVALFWVEGDIHAVDNHCPHEGYPLKQGTVNEKDCTLTCQWHNWKFNLKTGQALKGEDAVRVYKTRIHNGMVQVDLSDEPLEVQAEKILKGLREAVEERQYGRISREVTRLVGAGIDPLVAIRDIIARTYDMLQYGMNHAYAAVNDWLTLAESYPGDREVLVICVSEALDHIAHDTLMHKRYAYPQGEKPFDGQAFLEAVEGQDEAEATALVRGAVSANLPWSQLEYWFSKAALAHYNAFGHSIIYTSKIGRLLERLGQDSKPFLLLTLTRHLCIATREDLIPDFRDYQPTLNGLAGVVGTETSPRGVEGLIGSGISRALAWTADHLKTTAPETLYESLLEANGRNLLHFKLECDQAVDVPVSKTASWLDTTHGVTMSSAVRIQCSKFPDLWPMGLLQLACFVGRNREYVDLEADTAPYEVSDAAWFFAGSLDKLLDHGINEPIYAVHLLKTALAIQLELQSVNEACRSVLLKALKRFLEAPIKQKHMRRLAKQAEALILKG